LATQSLSSTKPSAPTKNKNDKIVDISRSLLLQDQQNDEIHDSEISIANEENGERTKDIREKKIQ
jgi:hypothetical protein